MPSLSDTKAYFDRHAVDLRRDVLVDKSDALRAFFDALPENARVLECGAGTGLYTIPLLRAGAEVISVDLSAQSLRALEKAAAEENLAQNLTTLCGNFAELQDSFEGQFDAILFVKVLHHFPTTRFIVGCLTASFKKLRPGGAVMVFEPNGDNPLWWLVLKLRGKAYFENEKNVFLITRNLFHEIFASCRPRTTTLRYHYVLPRGLVRRLPALQALDRLLCRLPDTLLKRLAVNTYVEIKR